MTTTTTTMTTTTTTTTKTTSDEEDADDEDLDDDEVDTGRHMLATSRRTPLLRRVDAEVSGPPRRRRAAGRPAGPPIHAE